MGAEDQLFFDRDLPKSGRAPLPAGSYNNKKTHMVDFSLHQEITGIK